MTVQDQLVNFLRSETGWVASGVIQRREWKNDDGTVATPRSIVRRLQEKVEDGTLEVMYGKKNAAFYRHKFAPKKVIEYVVEFRHGIPYRVPKITYETN